MVVNYEAWIVALSVLVAIQGAYVGLNLALELPGSAGGRRKLLLAGAALTLAVAIWSMHFVGMLAVRSPIRIDYHVLPTLVSFLVCVLVVGLAVFLASSAPSSNPVLAVSAVVMGAGIVSMHFIGMLALHANAVMHHDPRYVIASFLIGVAASRLALHFAFDGRVRPPLLAASVALGLAISGMHYTAMAGMTLHAQADLFSGGATTLSGDLLAVIVATVAFGSSFAFFSRSYPMGPPARPHRQHPAGRTALCRLWPNPPAMTPARRPPRNHRPSPLGSQHSDPGAEGWGDPLSTGRPRPRGQGGCALHHRVRRHAGVLLRPLNRRRGTPA